MRALAWRGGSHISISASLSSSYPQKHLLFSTRSHSNEEIWVRQQAFKKSALCGERVETALLNKMIGDRATSGGFLPTIRNVRRRPKFLMSKPSPFDVTVHIALQSRLTGLAVLPSLIQYYPR